MKVLAILFIGTVAFAVDYTKLDRELAKQKQENILRELRIDRKTGKLREASLDKELKRAEVIGEAFLTEAYKGLISAKSLPVRSSGYVGKVLLTDNIALYNGMNTPYGEVNVEEMKVGSFWINVGSFERTQVTQQAPQLPTAGQQAIGIPAPPPPPPLPPRQPQPQQPGPTPQPQAQQAQPPVQAPQLQAPSQLQPPVR